MTIYDPWGFAIGLIELVVGLGVLVATVYEWRRPAKKTRRSPACQLLQIALALLIALSGLSHDFQALDAPHQQSAHTALLNGLGQVVGIPIAFYCLLFMAGQFFGWRWARRG